MDRHCHTHRQTLSHGQTLPHTQTDTVTWTDRHTHTHRHCHTDVRDTHTHTHRQTLSQRQTDRQTHTDTATHTDTHTHTHTHTHRQILSHRQTDSSYRQTHRSLVSLLYTEACMLVISIASLRSSAVLPSGEELYICRVLTELTSATTCTHVSYLQLGGAVFAQWL